MSSAKQVTTSAFDLSASERLLQYLQGQGINNKLIVPLTPDASTRNYFRIPGSREKRLPPFTRSRLIPTSIPTWM